MRCYLLKNDDIPTTRYKKNNLFNRSNLSKDNNRAKEQWNQFDMKILKLIEKNVFRKPFYKKQINLISPSIEDKPIIFQNSLLNSINNDINDNSQSFQSKETINNYSKRSQTTSRTFPLVQVFNQTNRLRNLKKIVPFNQNYTSHDNQSLNDDKGNLELNNYIIAEISNERINYHVHKKPKSIEMAFNKNEDLIENNNSATNWYWKQSYENKTAMKESFKSSRNKFTNLTTLKSHHRELIPLKNLKGTKMNFNYKIVDCDFRIPSKLVKLSNESL